jgi:hypothetical protein
VTNEELQAMLAAAYGGQINPANMGLNAEPRSEWDSYKYNQANPGRTAGEVEPKSIGWSEYAQEWYDRLIGTPLKGMAGAGDALLGRANPDLESFEKNVLDALSLYAGPSIARGTFAKPSQTTLGIFGGQGAKEAPLRMRDIAEKALAAGKDPDEVWKYTGWKPGMEGKMRFEIDDRNAKLISNLDDYEMLSVPKPLPEVYQHPDLYKQYPELKNVNVVSTIESGGSFDAKNNLIHVGTGSSDKLGTLTHEIQHWVQQKEGFARGGAPSLPDMIAKHPDIVSSELSGTSKAIFDEAMASGNVREATSIALGNVDEVTLYKRLAGEIEARDAAARRTWDTDMRRAVPPDMRKDAIIRMGDSGERQMSNVIPKGLESLASEAKKYNTFEDFKKAFLIDIKHGDYYHITDNPNFTIDPKLGPRDMSSMASGTMTPDKLMVTSHLENWVDRYPERKYVAVIDMSDVEPKKYYQVKRGFGNEFFVDDPKSAKVTKVIPIKQALKESNKKQKLLENNISSEEDLRNFYEIANKKNPDLDEFALDVLKELNY